MNTHKVSTEIFTHRKARKWAEQQLAKFKVLAIHGTFYEGSNRAAVLMTATTTAGVAQKLRVLFPLNLDQENRRKTLAYMEQTITRRACSLLKENAQRQRPRTAAPAAPTPGPLPGSSHALQLRIQELSRQVHDMKSEIENLRESLRGAIPLSMLRLEWQRELLEEINEIITSKKEERQ